MNVSLTPELEKFVYKRVKAGRYNSASEVVREALRLLEDHEQARAARLLEFRTELDRRVGSLDRDESMDGEEVFAQLRQQSLQLRKTRGGKKSA